MKVTFRITIGALSAGLFFSAPAFAQQGTVPCGTDDPVIQAQAHGNDPQRLAEIEAATRELEEFTANFDPEARGGGEIVIPVVFHIIHAHGPENISNEQVVDAMRVLNDDFNKLNTDWDAVNPAFLGLVADIGVSFRLASVDPSGNCTNGITRTVSHRTYDGDSQMKALIQWPRDRYMNVWVCHYANGAAGYTQYPGSVAGAMGANGDGIVLKYDYVGTIGTGSAGRSRTLTHEVGHWINLMHVWGNSNEPGQASNCNMDDGVADTPNSIGWTTCDLNGTSCGSVNNNVENYMEYSYCSKMFTEGQKARMLASLNSNVASRSNLWTVANRQLTGTWVEPTGVCAAIFEANTQRVCTGTAVQFTDRSLHTPTSWNWTFPGGTPATSTAQNPSVTYSTPGTYSVTLQVGDGSGSATTTSNGFIHVMELPGGALPFVEGFESATTLPNNTWSTFDMAGDGTFTVRTDAAYSGSKSLRLSNYGVAAGSVDELISAPLDLSGLTENPVLSFRYAYRQRNSSNNDELRIFVSRDCGESWALRALLQATNTLSTAATGSAFFTPNNQSQWGYREVTNINSTYFEDDVRIKFVFVSGGGNNLWLDDINLNGLGVGFEGVSGGSRVGLTVVPNPVNGNGSLLVDMPVAAKVSMDVLDALGRVVVGAQERHLPQGDHRWELPSAGLGQGIYFVRLRYDDQVVVTRFMHE